MVRGRPSRLQGATASAARPAFGRPWTREPLRPRGALKRGQAQGLPPLTRDTRPRSNNARSLHRKCLRFQGIARYTFQARAARSRAGVKFTSFLPAISKQALSKISGEVRRWRLHRKVPLTIAELAK